jgi:CubicO group peptidase (beta-lactamase class C family)
MSTLVHILVDQGLAGYDDPVAKHWPAFGSRGKDKITIRDALCHQAGLHRITDMIHSASEMLDWEHMKSVVADAQPAHEPGVVSAYHGLTYGWLIGGLIEGITGKSLQRVLTEELVDPLGLDGMFIGMPHNELYRRATLSHGVMDGPEPKEEWRETLEAFAAFALEKVGIEVSEIRAALFPFDEAFDWNAEETVMAAIPSANGQFTARSLARMYAMIAGGGELDGVRLLSKQTVRQLSQVQVRTRDKVMVIPMHWRMGYHRGFSLGTRAPEAFGHYGYGGSGAFCDPSRNLAVAMTNNSGAGSPTGDSRMPRIARATLRAVDRIKD